MQAMCYEPGMLQKCVLWCRGGDEAAAVRAAGAGEQLHWVPAQCCAQPVVRQRWQRRWRPAAPCAAAGLQLGLEVRAGHLRHASVRHYPLSEQQVVWSGVCEECTTQLFQEL